MKHIPIKFLDQRVNVGATDSAEDAKESTQQIERLANDTRHELARIGGANPLQRAGLLLQLGRAVLRLEKMDEAWRAGREAFDLYSAAQQWEGAVQACDVMFLSNQEDSLAALGQGLWLAVTFPVNPELTVALLQHVVDETPPDSDGAAVAAVAAHYVVDLRAEGVQRDDLTLFTGQLLTTVARRHSGCDSQAEFDAWFKRLELDDPALFLPRLRNVIDVLVQDQWWIDRERLRESLPA